MSSSICKTVALILTVSICLAPGQAPAQDYQYAFDFGEQGVAAGRLNSPHDAAVDAIGNIYVADFDNDRVQKFDPGGRFLLTWGGSGSGDGQFNRPIGVTLDSSGNVYVVELFGHRVQKFDPTGNHLLTWGSQGAADGQFSFPSNIAAGPDGRIYVADRSNHRIQVFENNGTFVRVIGSPGTGNGQFQNPSGIDVTDAGILYVADEGNNRIQRFNSSGTHLTVFSSQGSGPGELDGPFDVVVNADGNVVVTDSNNGRIQVFGFDGEFLGQFGMPGAAASQFGQPRGITVDSQDNLYVADRDNHRIQMFVPLSEFELGNPDFTDGEFFGQSLAIDGALVAVGAPGRNGEGAVDIFRREGSQLVFVEEIQVPGLEIASNFGQSIAMSNGVLVIGAPEDEVAAKGNTLQAAVFQRVQNSFQFKFGLNSPQRTTGDRFGQAVAMDGDMVAVGAPMDNGGLGALYLFRMNRDSTFDEVAKLPPPGPGGKGPFAQLFGSAIAFKKGKLAIGGPGNGTDNAGIVALHQNITQNLSNPIVATGAGAGDGFGDSVDLSGDIMLVGAPSQDQEMGAAYYYPPGNFTAGIPLMPATRQTGARFGDSVAVQLRHAIIGSPGAFLFNAKGLSGGASFSFDLGDSGATNDDTDLPPESGTCGKSAKGCGVPGVEGYGETAEIEGGTSIVGAPQAYGTEGTVFVTMDTITVFDDSFEDLTIFD